jgi:hypothetical protein
MLQPPKQELPIMEPALVNLNSSAPTLQNANGKPLPLHHVMELLQLIQIPMELLQSLMELLQSTQLIHPPMELPQLLQLITEPSQAKILANVLTSLPSIRTPPPLPNALK